jgi:hypothetical protein
MALFKKEEKKELRFIDRDMILNSEDLATEEVEVPEWGGKVLVRALNGTERDAYEASLISQQGKNTQLKMDNIRAKLVVRAVVDPVTLKPIFTAGDIEALGRKSAAALDRVFSVAQRLSKITDADVEDLQKN